MLVIFSAFFAALVAPSHSHPLFDIGLRGWDGMGYLVRPSIEVDGTHHSYGGSSFLSSTSAPGLPGNVIIGYEKTAPFVVSKRTLYQVQNSTSILFANVVNITNPTSTPTTPETQRPLSSVSIHQRRPSFRLRLDKKEGGLQGEWMWNEDKGTLGFKAHGSTATKALFYLCTEPNLMNAVYLDLDESSSFPVGCAPIGLNSYQE